MNRDIITRYLIRVKVYASKDSVLTLIETDEVETDSQSLVNLPPLDIFNKDVELKMELELIEERKYKKSIFDKNMIERIYDDSPVNN